MMSSEQLNLFSEPQSEVKSELPDGTAIVEQMVACEAAMNTAIGKFLPSLRAVMRNFTQNRKAILEELERAKTRERLR